MAIMVYNTLGGHKEALVPQVPGRIGIYVCGPTVYDMSHIGHARAYVAFDTIVRYLRYAGYQVTFVRNYTDVDDKIIRRAAEHGQSERELSEHYIAEFVRDMSALGCAPADVEPRVTEHLPEIVAFVERLVAGGHAYESGGDVYYAVGSFGGYGKLSGRNTADLKVGARVEPGDKKRDGLDFALWKAAKPGEPAWDSPWGKGRPGWHIECSAMGMKYLGQTFDIHGGGKDLVFPHHENEIAQSEGATGQPYVRYWLHNGFVNVDGEKMSKSLGNFFTIRDVTARVHPEAVRYFLLTTHYRAPINFSNGPLEEAESRLHYLYSTWSKLQQALGAPATVTPAAGPLPAKLQDLAARFRAAMDDDFNTALALGELSEPLRLCNEQASLAGKKLAAALPTLAALRAALDPLLEVLGLLRRDPTVVLAEIKERRIARHGIDVAAVEALVARRNAARAAKDWAAADQARDELKAMKIECRDTQACTTWDVVG